MKAISMYVLKMCPIVLLSWLIAAPLNAQLNKAPFSPGEKLEYELSWKNIPAGSVSLEILPSKIIAGEEGYHFVLNAKSNKFIDIFFKVRDRIDAFADTAMTRSLHYQKKQHEGPRKRDEIVRFDWQNGQALYSNYGEQKDPIELTDGTFDPLSALYFTRMMDLQIGRELRCPITDGRKKMIDHLRVAGRETITLSNGKQYDTYRLEQVLRRVDGDTKKDRKTTIQLWVTADGTRLPVRIKSKLPGGHLKGELVAADGIS